MVIFHSYVNLPEGTIPTPLKNMSSSAGMMKFPIYRKVIKNVPNHQPDYQRLLREGSEFPELKGSYRD